MRGRYSMDMLDPSMQDRAQTTHRRGSCTQPLPARMLGLLVKALPSLELWEACTGASQLGSRCCVL